MANKFYLNIHAIPVFLTAFSILALVFFVFSKNPRFLKNRAFLCICISVFVWLAATAIGYLCSKSDDALFWFRIDNLGVAFISTSIFFFTTSFLEYRPRKSIMAGYSLSLIFGIIIIRTGLITRGVQKYNCGYFS